MHRHLINLLVYETGKTQYRLGSNIPLLAFAPWVVHGNKKLVVNEDHASLGCLMEEPIQMNNREDWPENVPEEKKENIIFLEPNHTHFILVS